MTDAFRYLCVLMGMDSPRISVYEASMWPEGGFETILAQGFLQQAENAESITCPDCFDHQEEIACVNYPGGIVRWFIPCPEHGRVEIQPNELKQWAINFGAVAQSLARQMNLKGECMELAPGHVWRLGRWNLPEGKRDILFAVGLTASHADSFRRAITGAHNHIVLVPNELPEEGLWYGKIPPLISLYHAANFVDDRIVLDPEYILDVVRQCEVEPMQQASLTLEQQRLLIRQLIRTEGQVRITDDIMLQAYRECKTYRAAEEFLTKQTGQSVGKDRIRRAVKRAGGQIGVSSDHDSESVVRSRSKNRRDFAADSSD